MMDCETLMDRHAIDATRVHVMTYLAKYSSVCNHDFGFFTEQTGISCSIGLVKVIRI